MLNQFTRLRKAINHRWRIGTDGTRSFMEASVLLMPNHPHFINRNIGHMIEELISYLLNESLIAPASLTISTAHLNNVLFDECDLLQYIGFYDGFHEFADLIDKTIVEHPISSLLIQYVRARVSQIRPALLNLSRKLYQRGMVTYELIGDLSGQIDDSYKSILDIVTDVFKAISNMQSRSLLSCFEKALSEEFCVDVESIDNEGPNHIVTEFRIVIVQYLALFRMIGSPRHSTQRMLQMAISAPTSQANLLLQDVIKARLLNRFLDFSLISVR